MALSIAGSDSGGGAGAQADLKTFAAHRVHGTTALTAITAQNTAEVRGVVVLEPDFVRLQIDTVLDDFDVRATKTGMPRQKRSWASWPTWLPPVDYQTSWWTRFWSHRAVTP